ncbi:MAG TPA: antitoxin VbhA family protein [Oligoflexia bacterium]|nr:antitoxin VbhA family protein [Oligoflexia bacterium]HMR24969.1 antitoxin VbhA family protein [Oligoflexia bacterium]
MNQQNITNILLSIIAVLLLVLVLQNQKPGMSYDRSAPPAYPQESDYAQDPHTGHNHAPEASNDPHGGEFNPSEMVYAALKCPSDETLPLASPSCSDKMANERRKAVDNAFAQGLTISKVFDAIIEKYGMNALTLEAQEIIKARQQ